MNTPADNEGHGGRDSLRHSLGGKAPSQSPERSLVEAHGERQLSGSVSSPSCLTGVGWGGGFSAYCPSRKSGLFLAPVP